MNKDQDANETAIVDRLRERMSKTIVEEVKKVNSKMSAAKKKVKLSPEDKDALRQVIQEEEAQIGELIQEIREIEENH